MHPVFHFIIGFFFLNFSWSARAQEPSLEDLEKMGSELDQAQISTRQDSNAINPNNSLNSQSNSAEKMAPAQDNPGLEPIDVRSRLKKIMEPNLFAGAPPVPGTLRNMAMGEAPEEYVIHEGDNLSDICDQLLDEPNYWPKLWALNPEISNPHFVYPGMKLRFYAGDVENPPFLQVVTEDDIVPVDKGGMVEKELVHEDINGMLMRSEIPVNQTVSDAKDLEQVPGIEDMFEVVGDRVAPDKIQLIIPAFIFEDYVDELGKVVGGSAGSWLIDRGQDIIIDPESEMQPGSTLTVIRKSGKIRTKNGNDFVGYRYEFIAQIRIEEKDKEDDTYRAKVVYNRLGVQPGDYVIPYRSINRFMPTKVPDVTPGASQQVVGFAEPFMVVSGKGFVFLDQTEQKLQEGSVYTVMQNVKATALSFLRSKLPDEETKIARAYILDASGSAALAYILNDSLEVRLGDRLGP